MRILIGGCRQQISTLNPVPCEYEFFDFLRGDEIRKASEGTNSRYGGAIAEFQMAFGEDDLELVFTYDAEGTAAVFALAQRQVLMRNLGGSKHNPRGWILTRKSKSGKK